jgi:hypothetical protein
LLTVYFSSTVFAVLWEREGHRYETHHVTTVAPAAIGGNDQGEAVFRLRDPKFRANRPPLHYKTNTDSFTEVQISN